MSDTGIFLISNGVGPEPWYLETMNPPRWARLNARNLVVHKILCYGNEASALLDMDDLLRSGLTGPLSVVELGCVRVVETRSKVAEVS